MDAWHISRNIKGVAAMAIIHAQGVTEYGELDVTITGDEQRVERITCEPSKFAILFQLDIAAGRGWMANDYHPPANTMLQAYAYCTNVFGSRNITVTGNIGTMENKPGVIY